MAAVTGYLGDEAPFSFRQAVEAMRAARVRSEIRIEEAAAPRRLASYAYALDARVLADGEELADGRLVLLHEPGGHEAWHGEFRLVTLARASLEPEMAGDPLLPEVSWSWLTGALMAHGARHRVPSGTVSRASSHYFGGLGEQPDDTRIEIRASWTPCGPTGHGPAGGLDAAAHLAAWSDLLCACAGLPPCETAGPVPEGLGGVVPLPKRRR